MTNLPQNPMTEQQEIDRDLDLFEAEREYERTKPKLSDVEWLHVFPEARKQYGKGIKTGLIVEKFKARWEIEFIKWKIRWEMRKLYAICNIPQDQWLIDQVAEGLQKKKTQAEKRLNSAIGRLQFFNTIGQQDKPGRKIIITPDMVRRAKEYPMEKLIEFNRAGFARCLNHNDQNASMYCKGGFAYCFSCNYRADTIEILMKRDGYKFKEAVLKLQ